MFIVMNGKRAIRSIVMVGSLLLVASGLEGCLIGGGGVRPTPPATTGSISVALGFGAATSVPYQCTGSGTVTITSADAPAQSANYSFSGFSETGSSPACNTAVSFSNLQPGTWTIQVSPSGATCQRQVSAGQPATANIRVDVGTCY